MRRPEPLPIERCGACSYLWPSNPLRFTASQPPDQNAVGLDAGNDTETSSLRIESASYATASAGRRAGFRRAPTSNPLNGSCLSTRGAMAMASAMASSGTLPSHSPTTSVQVGPSSSCSRTIHTMMRVPLKVGCPPQILGSATMCRPSSILGAGLCAFDFILMSRTMPRRRVFGKPRNDGCRTAASRHSGTVPLLVSSHLLSPCKTRESQAVLPTEDNKDNEEHRVSRLMSPRQDQPQKNTRNTQKGTASLSSNPRSPTGASA